MTAGQVVAIVSLLARMYSVDPALLQCIVHAESDYNVNATNGVHKGALQYRDPDDDPEDSTWLWLAEIAAQDERFLHAYLVSESTPYDAVAAIALGAWAISDGRGEEWSTFAGCEEGQ